MKPKKASVMKTARLIGSIALVALATVSYGQRLSIKEGVFGKQQREVKFVTADYRSNEASRIEGWMHDLRSWSGNRNTRNSPDAPIVCKIMVTDRVEVICEEEMVLESWMEVPFESIMAEEVLSLESWMTAPFESPALEEELVLESWMTTPFMTSDPEDWMCTARI